MKPKVMKGQDKVGSHLKNYNAQKDLGVKPKQMNNNPSRHTKWFYTDTSLFLPTKMALPRYSSTSGKQNLFNTSTT